MTLVYSPEDWYWRVGDASPGTQVYSTFGAAYVPLTDPRYVAWLAGDNTPTNIATQAELVDVLNAADLVALRPPGTAEPAPVSAGQRFRQLDRLAALRPSSGTGIAPYIVNATAFGTVTHAANRLEVCPFVSPSQVDIAGVQAEVSTAVAASLFTVGIYTDDNGRPGTRIGSTEFSGATTGFRSFTFPSTFRLQPNTRYWAAIHSSAAIGYRAAAVGALAPLGIQAGANTIFTALRASPAYSSTLPATLSGLAGVSTAFPVVRFVVA